MKLNIDLPLSSTYLASMPCTSAPLRHGSKGGVWLKADIKSADWLGLTDLAIWALELGKAKSNTYIKNVLLTVAILKAGRGNTKQSCSPLKTFEFMVRKKAIGASDLLMKQEITKDSNNSYFINPDCPRELSKDIRPSLKYPEKRKAQAVTVSILISRDHRRKRQKRGRKSIQLKTVDGDLHCQPKASEEVVKITVNKKLRSTYKIKMKEKKRCKLYYNDEKLSKSKFKTVVTSSWRRSSKEFLSSC